MHDSPFPGMDPFLEDPVEWPGVHLLLIAEMAKHLSALITPDYFVRVQQRVYLVSADEEVKRKPIIPDLYLIREPQEWAGTALAPDHVTTPTLIEPVYELEAEEPYLEIWEKSSREVVTVLELLSPSNKASHYQGFKVFQEKRRDVMNSPVHWVEIDLLRGGLRPREVTGKSHYYALLKRGNRARPYEVWFFNLDEPMPTIAIPLRFPATDVSLELQAVFREVYRQTRYADSLDYRQPVPEPPLKLDEQNWVHARLQAWMALGV
jgi:hypothetical protein